MTTMDAVDTPFWPRVWAVLISLLTAALVAVPVAMGWLVGFVIRCAVLIRAATIEAYEVGRG